MKSLYSEAQTERILRHASECTENGCGLPSEDCAMDGELRGLLLEFDRLLNHAPQIPIPMLLWCPNCAERHIDVDEFATEPHHTHACQLCGMVWRPAIVDTVGVLFLPGFKNAPREVKP